MASPSEAPAERAGAGKAPDAFRTISEVAEHLDLPQHVLRFWETRFGQIRPLKRGGGRRYYRPEDVALLAGIKHLLYGQGYTIKGVQRILKGQGLGFVQNVGRSPAIAASLPPPGTAEAGEAPAAEGDAHPVADAEPAPEPPPQPPPAPSARLAPELVAAPQAPAAAAEPAEVRRPFFRPAEEELPQPVPPLAPDHLERLRAVAAELGAVRRLLDVARRG